MWYLLSLICTFWGYVLFALPLVTAPVFLVWLQTSGRKQFPSWST